MSILLTTVIFTRLIRWKFNSDVGVWMPIFHTCCIWCFCWTFENKSRHTLHVLESILQSFSGVIAEHWRMDCLKHCVNKSSNSMEKFKSLNNVVYVNDFLFFSNVIHNFLIDFNPFSSKGQCDLSKQLHNHEYCLNIR